MGLLVAKIAVIAAVVAVAVLREVRLHRRFKRDEQNGTGIDALSPRGRRIALAAILVVGVGLVVLRWPFAA